MNDQDNINKIAGDLETLGIRHGDMILVHSSLKSLGYVNGGPETVIQGLLKAIGDDGTLLLPALSYQQNPHHIHNVRETPSNVGTIPEYFRKKAVTIRSFHPTHSVCGIGKSVSELFKDHHLDQTPCGQNSPLNKMIGFGAKIVMLGCGLRPNTTMHALEEYENPPYLFGDNCVYTITDWDGNTYEKSYKTHGFVGWTQRYDRIAELDSEPFIISGKVLDAQTFVIDTKGLRSAVLSKLRKDPCFFVDKR
jgi:aminoglycoside 3-N-acetyltransferase